MAYGSTDGKTESWRISFNIATRPGMALYKYLALEQL